MALLVLVHEGLTLKRIPLNKPQLTVGRRTDSDVFIDDMLASQQHARLEVVENKDAASGVDHFIEDLESTNHTFVNGEAVSRHKLVHNDVIRIGKHTFKFLEESEEAGDKTTKLHKSWLPGVYYTKD